jgi:hypothetical protein
MTVVDLIGKIKWTFNFVIRNKSLIITRLIVYISMFELFIFSGKNIANFKAII